MRRVGNYDRNRTAPLALPTIREKSPLFRLHDCGKHIRWLGNYDLMRRQEEVVFEEEAEERSNDELREEIKERLRLLFSEDDD